jgi:hypothetical protein
VELVLIFLCVFLVLFSIYFLGSVLMYPFRYYLNIYKPLVILSNKIFFGTIGVITLFSLLTTFLQSINLIFLLVYLLFLFFNIFINKPSPKSQFHYWADFKYILNFMPILIIATIVGLLRYHYFYDNHVFNHDDNLFYLQLSRFMPIMNLENPMPWNKLVSTNPIDLFLIPYHYGNLWFSSFCIFTCSFLLPMHTYYFVVTPVMIVLVVIIMSGIVSNFVNIKIKTLQVFGFFSIDLQKYSYLLYSLIGLLFTMYWGYVPKVPYGFIHAISIEHKIFNYMFPFVFAVLCYLNKNYLLSIISFTSIFILDFVFVPYAVIVLVVFIFLYLFDRKNKVVNYFVVVLTLTCFYIILFYSIKGSLLFTNTHKEGVQIFSLNYWSEGVSIIFTNFKRHLFSCFPFYIAIVIMFLKRKQIGLKYHYIAIFIVGIVFSSFIVTGATHFHREYWQFLRVINPSTSILLLLFFALSFGNTNIISNKGYYILLFVVLIQASLATVSQSVSLPNNDVNGKNMNVSDSTLSKIALFIGTEKKPIVVANFIEDINHNLGVVYYSYNFSGYLKQDIAFIEINIPDSISKSIDDHQRNLMKINPFYQYIQTQKENKTFKSIKESQVCFLKEQKIKFILMEEKVYFSILNENISDSLIFKQGRNYKLYKCSF